MPSAPRIWLNYRPVRIGWVIPDRDIARLATAAAWSSCLWGGRFNPIIPIHDVILADQLVKTFAVDLLRPVHETDATRNFIDRFPYLRHDRWHETIFRQRRCEFADIRHVVRRIYQNQDKQAESALILPVWDPADVFHPLFSTVFGQYPTPSEDVADYKAGIRQAFDVPEKVLPLNQEVPRDLVDTIPPLLMTGYDLTRRRDPAGWLNPGVVLGSATDFDDLGNNLDGHGKHHPPTLVHLIHVSHEVSAYNAFDWMTRFFELCKLSVERSEPGLRCKRLINQFGSLQDCPRFGACGVYCANTALISPSLVAGQSSAFATLILQPEQSDSKPSRTSI
jgi:hypothetical protein